MVCQTIRKYWRRSRGKWPKQLSSNRKKKKSKNCSSTKIMNPSSANHKSITQIRKTKTTTFLPTRNPKRPCRKSTTTTWTRTSNRGRNIKPLMWLMKGNWPSNPSSFSWRISNFWKLSTTSKGSSFFSKNTLTTVNI